MYEQDIITEEDAKAALEFAKALMAGEISEEDAKEAPPGVSKAFRYLGQLLGPALTPSHD